MGRRKATKIPFFKIKLKSKTIYGIFSLIFLLFFVLSILSFNQEATLLSFLNNWLNNSFGRVAILFPVIFLFGAGVMVQSKKFKVIKPNWFLGYILVFISSLIVLGTGDVGAALYYEFEQLLSAPGTMATFSFLFLVGVLIAFEISLPDFVKKIAVVFGSMFEQVKKGMVSAKQKKEKAALKAEKEFVGGGVKKEISLPTKATAAPLGVKTTLTSDEPLIASSTKMVTGEWKFPPLSLLNITKAEEAERGDVKNNADEIESALESFGIKARVADINYGPAVTQYALQIAKGVKLNKITSLSNNLALALASPHGLIRIEAPIPGKSLVGIEVPNIKPQTVTLKTILGLPEFADRNKHLLMPMGLDVSGAPKSIQINEMPHILIAGTTGSGKSVLLSSWIATLLFRTTPDELRLLLIDPKRVTFMPFDGIPHLLTNVITDPKDTISALKWSVKEMENRYKELSDAKSRDIISYNNSLTDPAKKMPFIVIIIDELADLMMYASKEVEDSITRIAQKARAVGIYLVIATQRPSVDVITGLMKANIPARIAFNVSSMIDSRVIIDMPGAEKLLGRGDMLFLSPNSSKPMRIQGPYIDDKEINNLVDFLKKNTQVIHYTEEVTEQKVKTMMDTSGNVSIQSDNRDPLFEQAIQIVCEAKKASASLLQRRCSIGYSRAARVLDELQEAGIVGPPDGSKPREVLIHDPSEVMEQTQ